MITNVPGFLPQIWASVLAMDMVGLIFAKPATRPHPPTQEE